MTSIPAIVDEAESVVRLWVTELVRPRKNECLCCYVARLLNETPCDGSHRHAVRYRDATAPRATALVERLGRIGACCCDCEIFLNGYQPRVAPTDDDSVDPLAPCEGVRRGSVQPCRNWVRIRRR